jgi:hypothetical protein
MRIQYHSRMEVTVTKLRRDGVKLSPQELAEAERVHGFLEIYYWVLENGKGPPQRIKELVLKSHPDATSRPLLTLTGADQKRLKGDNMVYVGAETLDGQSLPQAWWVKLDIRKPPSDVRPY